MEQAEEWNRDIEGQGKGNSILFTGVEELLRPRYFRIRLERGITRGWEAIY